MPSRNTLIPAAFLSTGAILLFLWAAGVPAEGGRGWAGPKSANAEEEKHGGDIVFEVKKNKAKKIHSLFSHQRHLDKGHKCNDCHNNKVFKRERKLGVNSFKMKDIMKGKACGACHDGKTVVNNVTVFAPKRNCDRCHSIKFRKKRRR